MLFDNDIIFANSLGTRVHDSRSPLSVPPLASIAFLSVGTWSSLQSALTVQLQVHPRVYRVCKREQQSSQQHLSTAISSGIAASPFIDLSSSISRHAKCSTADHVCMYSSTHSTSVHHNRQKCPRCTKHAMASPASLPLLVPCNCQLSPRPCRLGAHDQTPGAKMPPSSALRFARPPPSLVFGTPLWSGPMRAPAGTSAGLFVCRSTG